MFDKIDLQQEIKGTLSDMVADKEMYTLKAMHLKNTYDALKEVGFTEEQAVSIMNATTAPLEIIKQIE